MPVSRPDGLDSPWVPKLMRLFSQANVKVYEATGGRLWNRWWLGAAFRKGGVPICLVTTRGRKSGLQRTAPLLFLEDGSRVVLVGSQGGMRKHPQWALNLLAEADCEVQRGPRRMPMRARVAEGSERAELWAKLVELYSDFDSYQSWTDRQLKVFVLESR